MRRHLLVLSGIAVACAALAYALSFVGGRSGPRSALGAAPEGSTVVAHADVAALRASPLWAAFVDQDAGLERIVGACGFDPIERVATVAVFVLGSEQRPLERLGFVARGDLPRAQLVDCVQRIVEEDGGGIRRATIEGVAAIASEHGDSRAAFLGSDRLVGGDEQLVRQAILVDRGDAPSADADAVLARLWQRVASRGELIVVGHLPPNWRSWLGRLGGGIDVRAIEQVRAVAIGARIRSGLGVTLALETDDAGSAQALVDEARARIDGLLRDPLLGLSAAAGALRRIDLEVRDHDAVATLDLDESQLASVVELVRLALSRRREAAVRAQAERAAQRPSIAAPDEQLQAGGTHERAPAVVDTPR